MNIPGSQFVSNKAITAIATLLVVLGSICIRTVDSEQHEPCVVRVQQQLPIHQQ